MAEKNAWIWVVGIVIALLVLQGGALSGLLGGGSTGQTGNGGTTVVTSSVTMQASAFDKQQAGTAVGYSTNYFIDGVLKSGATTMSQGQKLDALFINGTAYHSGYVGADIAGDENIQAAGVSLTPQSGATTIPVNALLNKNASVSENIYTTTGLVITNGGGAQNQSDLGNGVPYNFKDEMTGTALANTQDMLCVFEFTAGTNASTSPSGVTLDGTNPISTSKPIWYTGIGSNSNYYLFKAKPIVSSEMQTHSIGLNLLSTGRPSAGNRLIKSCYTYEYFIDPITGKTVYDVADSLGNLKSLASYKYTIYFS